MKEKSVFALEEWPLMDSQYHLRLGFVVGSVPSSKLFSRRSVVLPPQKKSCGVRHLGFELGRGLGRDEKAPKGLGVRVKEVNQHGGESTRSRTLW